MPPQQSFGYNQELDALQYQQQDLRNSSSLNSGTRQNTEIKEQVKPSMDQLVTLLKQQPHNNENSERQNRRRGNFSNN